MHGRRTAGAAVDDVDGCEGEVATIVLVYQRVEVLVGDADHGSAACVGSLGHGVPQTRNDFVPLRILVSRSNDFCHEIFSCESERKNIVL